jgi:hypothetical protein
LTIAVSLASSSLSAQPRDPAGADALFREGRVALKSGDYVLACDKFAASEHLDPGAGTLLNLATCEERLGHLASAWAHLQEAIDLLAPANDDRLDLARKSYADLNKRLPHLVIRLSADAPVGTHVERDGIDVGESLRGFAQPVDPGNHLIAVQAPGHVDTSSTVHLDEGETREVTVSPGPGLPETQSVGATPLPLSPTPSGKGAQALPAPPDKAPSRSLVLPVVFGGIGIAGLVTGAVTGIVMLNVAGLRHQACPDKLCANPDSLARSDRLASEGNTLSAVTPVAFGIGVTALGAATFFALRQRDRPVGTAPIVRPWLDAHTSGLDVSVSF